MHAPVTHTGAHSRARRMPAGDVSDWAMGVAFALTLLSVCAVALAYVVVLIVA